MTQDLLAHAAKANVEWDHRAAKHLFDRAGFSITPQQLDAAVAIGLDACVDRLVTEQPESDEFQQVEPLLRRVALDASSIESLTDWWLFRCRFSTNPLREKMAVFWHNHFATSYTKVQSVPWMLDQNEQFRTHALGDFKQLLHAMAQDVAMLVWLDGNDNRKRHPNENFAREVMELFSLGVGNYTEHDIQEAARAFSGWHVRKGKFWFNELQHDNDEKTVFEKTGPFNGNEIIDLCLSQEACPRFLATKLLKLFVTPDPQAREVEALASRIRGHDFHMDKVMSDLLRSRLFFAAENRRRNIKSPLDFVIGSLTMLDVAPKFEPVRNVLALLGQELFQPPTVKGWDGHRLWISSATLLIRSNFVTEVFNGDRFGKLPDLDRWLPLVEGAEASQLVDRLRDCCLGLEVDAAVAEQLSEFASSGDRSANWMRGLVQLVMSLPEYQLL